MRKNKLVHWQYFQQMVSDYKIEKEEFIQGLKELDEVKEIKKRNVTNNVIYVLLLLAIPLVFFLGFYYKIKIICIIAILLLVISLLYTFLNDYYF